MIGLGGWLPIKNIGTSYAAVHLLPKQYPGTSGVPDSSM